MPAKPLRILLSDKIAPTEISTLPGIFFITNCHDQIRKCKSLKSLNTHEYRLAQPTDRMLAIYRVENGEYGKTFLSQLMCETKAYSLFTGTSWQPGQLWLLSQLVSSVKS